VVVPEPNAQEAAVVDEFNVYHVAGLSAVTQFMAGASELRTQRVDRESIFLEPIAGRTDLADVKGQAPAKRAVLIAAAGSHNLLML
jgi:magnesium chelatase family protein